MSQATTYEGRRQLDKVAARAAAIAAENEGKVQGAQADLLIQDARDKAKDARRRRKEQTKTQRLAEKARRRERRATARKARNERFAVALSQPLPWVMTVVVTSIAFAFPGQFSAVVGLGVIWVLALLVPVFIEGSTWAMAWLRKWAVENDKPATLYMVMTWVFALMAAGLNAWHHKDEPELAAVFAASSLFGVAVFEIYMHSQQHRVGGKSAEEIKLALVRRLRHPRVSRRAAWLRSAAGMSPEQAWETAWRQIFGCAPGVTKRVLKRYNRQTAKIGSLVEAHDGLAEDASLALFEAPPAPLREVTASEAWAIDPDAIARVLADPANSRRAGGKKPTPAKIEKGTEGRPETAARSPHAPGSRAANEQVKPNNPPSAKGREKGTGEAGSGQVRAARAAAAQTARAATPEQAEAEKRAAREWALAQLRAGREELKWRDIQNYFAKEIPDLQQRVMRGETWCRQRLTEAQAELAAASPLHLVANH
ncbi:hypothetical protein ACFYWP_37235 [Actinacidiphila glaucinigra]|uniref:hypothetical protein n=1 Tax=Actinacidiphila glaucinigra TaxID=235986 RepID=UPI0036ACBBA8